MSALSAWEPPRHHVAPELTESPWTLEVLGRRPALAFAVYGSPAPQGSKKALGTRKVLGRDGAIRDVTILGEMSKGLTAWRNAIAMAAVTAEPMLLLPASRLDGPLVMDLVFSRAPRATMPKDRARWGYPDTAPDVDKLTRAALDGLGEGVVNKRYPKGDPRRQVTPPVIANDSRVVAFRRLAKVWAGGLDPDALPEPGAVIRVWRVSDPATSEKGSPA